MALDARTTKDAESWLPLCVVWAATMLLLGWLINFESVPREPGHAVGMTIRVGVETAGCLVISTLIGILLSRRLSLFWVQVWTYLGLVLAVMLLSDVVHPNDADASAHAAACCIALVAAGCMAGLVGVMQSDIGNATDT